MTAPIRNTRKFRIPIYRVKNQRVKTGYVLRGTPVFDPLIYLVKYRGLGGEVQVQMYTVTYTHTDAHIQTHTRTHTHTHAHTHAHTHTHTHTRTHRNALQSCCTFLTIIYFVVVVKDGHITLKAAAQPYVFQFVS